jgi:transcriptional regulator with XRE-family HTH domain
MSSIGAKIREARETANLSVPELAAECGFTPQAVRLWEKDARDPMFWCVAAIAAATGKDLRFFIDNEEVPGESAADTAVHRA